MARLTGINLRVFWADSAGTIEIPTVRSFEPGISQDVVDYSANGDDLRNWYPARITATPRMTYIDFNGIEGGVAGTAIRARLRAGSNGTLIWAERGTASGNPRGALRCSITMNDAPVTYDGEVERNVFFMPSAGTFIADPGTAVW